LLWAAHAPGTTVLVSPIDFVPRPETVLQPDVVVVDEQDVDDPYAHAKSLLLDRIAASNGCRAVWSKNLGVQHGFRQPRRSRDRRGLFTSLLVQATEAMVRAGCSGRSAASPHDR
jgi:hypothetical protein